MQLIQTPGSSSIAAYGYGLTESKIAEKRFLLVLRVVFHTGKIYDYHNVPISLYDDMEKAESVGKFFNREIKGKYKFEYIGDISKGDKK